MMGTTVQIKHDNNLISVYQSLSNVKVKVDDKFVDIDLGIDSFVVGADDLQNYSVNAKEEKHEFMRLVSRNWIFVLLLLILGVAYFRIQRQKSR